MVTRTSARSAGLATLRGSSSRFTTVQIYAVAILLAAVLVYVSTLGQIPMYVAMGAAAFVAILALLGLEHTGILVLMGGYFTAPFYKGVAPTPGSPVTGTDVLILLGFLLLFPVLLKGSIRLPTVYVVGVTTVLGTGLVASAFSSDPKTSLISLVFWMVVMLGLPVAYSLWMPSSKIIDLLASSFIAGQIFSLVVGAAKGNIGQNRHAGLSTHPNYLGQAGMLCVGLLMYLGFRYWQKSMAAKLLLIGAGAACGASVLLSGSRAATVVLAVLILMIPVVERSAITGFLLAIFGAVGFVALPILIDIAGPGSSIARIGSLSGRLSNSERENGLAAGIDRFFEHPLRGTGLVDLFGIHNNFLEVAVAIGVFGLAGYFVVLYSFAKPLFGQSEYRRLCYAVWGYIGMGATVPGLYDRSVWAIVALSTMAMITHQSAKPAPPVNHSQGRDWETRPVAVGPSLRRFS